MPGATGSGLDGPSVTDFLGAGSMAHLSHISSAGRSMVESSAVAAFTADHGSAVAALVHRSCISAVAAFVGRPRLGCRGFVWSGIGFLGRALDG